MLRASFRRPPHDQTYQRIGSWSRLVELLVAFEAHGGKLETPVAHRLPGDRARLAKTARQLLVDLKALTQVRT